MFTGMIFIFAPLVVGYLFSISNENTLGVSLIKEHPAVVPIPMLIRPCVVTKPTVEPVPTIKLSQRLLSLYL